MRSLALLMFLGACAPVHVDSAPAAPDQPTWTDEGWDAPSDEARYFRTIGALEPDPVDPDAWTGFEEWRIEDEAGGVACRILWQTDGGTTGISGCPGCETAWDILCHSGQMEGPECETWFDPETASMQAQLDVGYDPLSQAVYMRSDGAESWDYVAKGQMSGDRLSYDERWDWY